MQKIISFFLLLTCFIRPINAQTPNWLWASIPKGNGAAEVADITIDLNGNSYITGHIRDTLIFGNDTLKTSSDGGTFIAKFDNSGNAIWGRCSNYSYYGYSSGSCLTTDVLGNIYLAGRFSDTIIFNSNILISKGSYDIFINKYDSFGNLIWVKSFGGTGSEGPCSLIKDNSGSIYFTGTFDSDTISFDSCQLIKSNTLSNIYIVKLNSSNNVLWARSIKGSGMHSNSPSKIATDNNSNLYICGNFGTSELIFDNDTIYNTDISATSSDIFIAKYNSLGHEIWARNPNGKLVDFANALCTNSNGKIFMTGSYSSDSLNFGTISINNPFHNGSFFVVQYDSSGIVDWAKSSSNSGGGTGYSILVNNYVNIDVAGIIAILPVSFDSIVINSTLNGGNLFIVTYNSLGKAIEVKTSEFVIQCSVPNIAADGQKNIYLSGSITNSPVIIGNDTLIFHSTSGGVFPFIAKYHYSCFNENITEIHVNNCSVFPNPANDKLNIITGEAKQTQISIYNIDGKLLLIQSLNQEITSIDISMLIRGMYIVKVNTCMGILVKKFIKE